MDLSGKVELSDVLFATRDSVSVDQYISIQKLQNICFYLKEGKMVIKKLQRSLDKVDNNLLGMSVHNEKREHQYGSSVAAADGMVLFKATDYFAEWEKPCNNDSGSNNKNSQGLYWYDNDHNQRRRLNNLK